MIAAMRLVMMSLLGVSLSSPPPQGENGIKTY
jgi:hypothetical protein